MGAFPAALPWSWGVGRVRSVEEERAGADGTGVSAERLAGLGFLVSSEGGLLLDRAAVRR